MPGAVEDLTGQAHFGEMAFLAELQAHVPGFLARSGPPDVSATEDDPFYWVIQGSFGAPGGRIPAGLVHCARYGLAIRDQMAARRVSDPEVFPLLTATRAERDDLEIWPEEAVALLRCSFAWDDALRLRPWTEDEAHALLALGFAETVRVDDTVIRAEEGEHIRAQYGADGYRLVGRDGPRSSYHWVERVQVVRQISHQRVSFRVFLMGGGV